MTGFEILTLLVVVGVVTTGIGYSLQKRKNTQEDDQTAVLPYTEEELDNIKLAEELYNKDLRPIVAKKAKPKVAKELDVVEAEFVAKVVQTSKVLPPDATINAEVLREVKQSKSEFPIDKPKKKRKYYPKKPKTMIQ